MRTKMLPSLLAALLFATLTGCAAAQKPSEEAATDKPSIEEVIPSAESLAFDPLGDGSSSAEMGGAAGPLLNGREVGDDLLIGGQPTTEQIEALQAAGYKTMINLQSENEEGVERILAISRNAFGTGAVHLPISNLLCVDEENAALLDEAIEAARERGGKIVLHCRSGGRASALYALARYRHHGVSAADAMEEAKAAGLNSRELIEHLGELLEVPPD